MNEDARQSLRIALSEPVPGVGHLRIVGSVDASNVLQLRTAIEGFFRSGIYRLVINLGEASYIASAGFGCFLTSLDGAREGGGHIVFASTPRSILKIFDIFGLSGILQFADDSEKALGFFRN